MNRKPVVAGIGELLWDVMPFGKQLGGAPCNLAGILKGVPLKEIHNRATEIAA